MKRKCYHQGMLANLWFLPTRVDSQLSCGCPSRNFLLIWRFAARDHTSTTLSLHAVSPDTAKTHATFIENLRAVGLNRDTFFLVPDHVARYLLDIKAKRHSSRRRVMRTLSGHYRDERPALHALLDCGAHHLPSYPKELCSELTL